MIAKTGPATYSGAMQRIISQQDEKIQCMMELLAWWASEYGTECMHPNALKTRELVAPLMNPPSLDESLAVMVKAMGGKISHMNGPEHPPMPWDTDGDVHPPIPRVDRAGEAGSASNELFDSERSTGEQGK